MKLGEALSVRARQAQKLNDLRSRIKANAKRQGDSPTAEDANLLMHEFLDLSTEHAKLVTKINKANVNTIIGDDTLLDLLSEREELNRQRSVYEMLANAASTEDSYRYMRSELPWTPAVDVSDVRKQADQVTEKVAELDAQIQTVNWQTDI